MDAPPVFSGGSGRSGNNGKKRVGLIFYSQTGREDFLRVTEVIQDGENTSETLKRMLEAEGQDEAIRISQTCRECDCLIAGPYGTAVLIPERFRTSKFILIIGFANDKRYGLKYLVDVFTGGLDMVIASPHCREEKLYCKDGVGVVYSHEAEPTGGEMNGQRIKSLTNWHEFYTFIGYNKWHHKEVKKMWNIFVIPEKRARNHYKSRRNAPAGAPIDSDEESD